MNCSISIHYTIQLSAVKTQESKQSCILALARTHVILIMMIIAISRMLERRFRISVFPYVGHKGKKVFHGAKVQYDCHFQHILLLKLSKDEIRDYKYNSVHNLDCVLSSAEEVLNLFTIQTIYCLPSVSLSVLDYQIQNVMHSAM